MSGNKHLFITAGLAAGILILGGGSLVWPNYVEARGIKDEIAVLRQKVSGYPSQADTVESLALALSESKRQVREELNVIPLSPNIAGLMRRLSLPVDGQTVLDQTFTAGSPIHAGGGESTNEEAMPLTVDIDANFDSVFALIRSAETMDRLVRVVSVRMVADRKNDERDEPLLTATVGLEAIFDSTQAEEGDGR